MDKKKQHLLASEDFKGLAKLMNGRFDELEENLKTEFKMSFNEVDDRLDKVDGRLDKIDDRLDKVDGRLDKIDKNMATKEDIKTLVARQELSDLRKKGDYRDRVFAEKLGLRLEEVDAKAEG